MLSNAQFISFEKSVKNNQNITNILAYTDPQDYHIGVEN